MAQTDAETKIIQGHTYKVLPLDPLIASDLAWDVLNTLSPILGALGGQALTEKGDVIEKLFEGADDDSTPNGFGPAFERALVGLFKNFTKETQRQMIATLLKVSFLCEGEKEARLDSVYSVHFRGHLSAQYQWLAFAMKVQFGDFFSEFAPVIARVAQALGRGQ